MFKPQGSKLGKKVAAYSPEITVIITLHGQKFLAEREKMLKWF